MVLDRVNLETIRNQLCHPAHSGRSSGFVQRRLTNPAVRYAIETVYDKHFAVQKKAINSCFIEIKGAKTLKFGESRCN